MSEPPPRPLDTIAPSPVKLHMSQRPNSPAPGRQNPSLRVSRGVRGNAPGGHGRPRSRSRTLRPASASRHAVTEPPKPEPTTTTSKDSTSPAIRRAGSAAVDLPGHRVPRIGLVAAEVAGVDRRLELATEALVLGGDAADDALDRARHVHPRTLGVRRGLAVAAAETDRARELARDELHLLAGTGGALGVVEVLGLLDLRAQVLEAGAVLALGLRVEQRAGVAVPAPDLDAGVARDARAARRRGALGRADDVDRVELDARVVEEQREVAQALGVLDEARAALVLHAPHVALATEARGEPVGRRGRVRGNGRGRGYGGVSRARRADHLLHALE